MKILQVFLLFYIPNVNAKCNAVFSFYYPNILDSCSLMKTYHTLFNEKNTLITFKLFLNENKGVGI